MLVCLENFVYEQLREHVLLLALNGTPSCFVVGLEKRSAPSDYIAVNKIIYLVHEKRKNHIRRDYMRSSNVQFRGSMSAIAGRLSLLL